MIDRHSNVQHAASAVAKPARRLSTPVRALGSLLILGMATATTVLGTSASWTDQTVNAGNTNAGGTISLTNDKSGASLFNAANIKPGDTADNTVKLRNAGTIPLAVSLTQDTITNGFAAGSAQLKIYDAKLDQCLWPANAGGACAAWGAWDASPTLTNLAIPASGRAEKWPVNEEHEITVSWRLVTTSPNSDQGKTAAFRLVWDAVQ